PGAAAGRGAACPARDPRRAGDGAGAANLPSRHPAGETHRIHAPAGRRERPGDYLGWPAPRPLRATAEHPKLNITRGTTCGQPGAIPAHRPTHPLQIDITCGTTGGRPAPHIPGGRPARGTPLHVVAFSLAPSPQPPASFRIRYRTC